LRQKAEIETATCHNPFSTSLLHEGGEQDYPLFLLYSRKGEIETVLYSTSLLYIGRRVRLSFLPAFYSRKEESEIAPSMKFITLGRTFNQLLYSTKGERE
jgi:hypothetical protein